MNMHRGVRIAILGVSIVGLAACSSTRHGGAGSISDANGPGGANGAYAQGLGGASGFQPSANCNVPQNARPYYFEFDSSTVNAGDTNHLQSLAQSLASNHSTVRVVGNTDSRGSREYNVALGWRRANSISSVLQQNGVKVTTESNGAEKPIAFGNSEEDFQCNRRADILDK